jgi:hypothetical protein
MVASVVWLGTGGGQLEANPAKNLCSWIDNCPFAERPAKLNRSSLFVISIKKSSRKFPAQILELGNSRPADMD